MSGIFKEGFFTQKCSARAGHFFSIRILEPLISEETGVQLVELFRGEGFGSVLALDGRIRFSEHEEHMYNEMLAHIPAYSHESPEKVLVLGGGGGGVVKELLKHPGIDDIDVCEYDPLVIEYCSKYFPWTKDALADSSVEVTTDIPALDFVSSKKGTYDIITAVAADTPGQVESPEYAGKLAALCAAALKPGGVFAFRTDSYLLYPERVAKICAVFKNCFKYSAYCSFPVTGYPGGALGLCIGSNDHPVTGPVRMPVGLFTKKLKSYSREIHKAVFTLQPSWNRMMDFRLGD